MTKPISEWSDDELRSARCPDLNPNCEVGRVAEEVLRLRPLAEGHRRSRVKRSELDGDQ